MNDSAPLSVTGNDRIVPGGNMSPFDVLTCEIEALYDEARNWADGAQIETQKQCDALDALDKALFEAGKKLDALRVEEKRPLDEQIEAIQARYNPFIQPKRGKVDLARGALNPLRTAWKDRERKRKEALAAQAAQEAAEAERKALEAMQASTGDLAAREEAERLANDARIARQDARRTAKAATTGLGLRTSYRPVLTDLSAAIRHYWGSRRPAFEELVMGLAAEDVRAGQREIPGFVVEEVKGAL